ncbi:MAG TPA: integration host factor subunit beta [Gammaproteobacteria bacterium]|nr:integration host factor subunit beta [Gammaproteobacteria bacterium]
MTKSELIEQLSEENNQLSHLDVELALKEVLEGLANALSSGRRIEVRGFGSFTVHHRMAHIGRNPKTGSTVRVPDKYVAHFKPAQELRQRVNNLS